MPDTQSLSTGDDGLTSLLLGVNNGQMAVQKVWAYQKALDSKLSLTYIARKIGLQSRGVTSENMQGKRRWPRKYWKALTQALGLDEIQGELVCLLLEYDETTTESEREILQTRIDAIRYFLRDRFYKFDVRQGLNLLASDIFSFFTLKPEVLTERAIIETFGKSRYPEILRALQMLLANQLIERTEDGFQRNPAKAKFFAFRQNELEGAASFMRESIRDAESQVGEWLSRTQNSCFGTTTMLVKREQYEKVLTQIKKDVFRYFSDLETNEGDTIIRFNMQIYPVVSEK